MEIINFTDYENPIFCDAFKKYFKEIEVEVNDWDKLFKEINNNDKDCSKVIIESNQMIGFLMFRIDDMKHWFFDEKIGFLREFWIDPNFRNQGLGTKLLKEFEEECKDANRIILTPDDNAIHFYEKNGYHFEQISAKNKMDVMVKIIEHPHYQAIQLNENHVDFVDEIYKEHIEVLHGNPISIEKWKEYLCDTNDPDESNYIITCNDENVGWLKVNGLLENKVFISMLVVSKKNQHQGVGSYAIRFAEQLADNKEIKEIYIQTSKDNPSAIQCYLKNGFEIEQEISIPLGDGNTYQGFVLKKENKLKVDNNMKKTAVLIYDKFCYFEISVALEILALNEKQITIFAKDMSPAKSEDGLTIMPDKSIFEIDLDEYDSLLLPGAMDIREAIENEEILTFIKHFNEQKKIIGAISIAPILLVKNGVMKDKPFMAGVNAEDLYEEGFTHEQLKYLHGWNDNLNNPIQKGYIISDHIITSVSYNFVHFGLAFAKMLGIDFPPKWFGIKEEK